MIDPRILGAIGSVCVTASNPVEAMIRAEFEISRCGWRILRVKDPVIKVVADNFKDKDLGLECFKKAQENGISIVFLAHTPDEELHTGDEPVSITVPRDIDLNEHHKIFSEIRSKGKCLFYEDSCSDIIDAHSIQKGQSLKQIARDGQVYGFSPSLSNMKKTKGRIPLVLQGINSISTFRGLCQHHDNLLFAPIDDSPLLPTTEQVLLYSYRSLLREVFTKDYIVEGLLRQLEGYDGGKAVGQRLKGLMIGNAQGLWALDWHKQCFDEAHKLRQFSDIRYILFASSSIPHFACSGGLFPDWDFQGNQLQDLIDVSRPWDLLTFSFAPMEQGWGFLLAWHKYSDPTCVPFIMSFQEKVRSGIKQEDLLFQLVLKNCENVAYSPDWIDSLSETDRQRIEELATESASGMVPIDPDYLTGGDRPLPNPWVIDSVEDNLDEFREAG